MNLPESQNSPVLVRRATPADAPALLGLIDALAAYEKLDPPDTEAKRRLIHDGFERNPPRFTVFLAFTADAPEKPAAYAFVLETYSSFLARPTLYVEDLFVHPDVRQGGVGSALFRELSREALRRGCGRMEFVCLDWNQLAIGFYEKRGARHMDEWRYYRLTADQLATLAGDGPV